MKLRLIKKRYFRSKSHFSVDPEEHLEVLDEGNIIL
jgi:hypothetical protein